MNIEENFMIDVEISDHDEDFALAIVFNQRGSQMKVIKTFKGKDAVYLYKILTGEVEIPKEVKNETK